jgi:hypothetical protein
MIQILSDVKTKREVAPILPGANQVGLEVDHDPLGAGEQPNG